MDLKPFYQTSDVIEKLKLGRNALRLYEEIGILHDVKRTESGYREYSAAHIERLQFTIRAKDAGFTLNEIKDLLDLLDSQNSLTCGTVATEVSAKMTEIEEKLELLKNKKMFLGEFLETCQSNNTESPCQVVGVGFSKKACCN